MSGFEYYFIASINDISSDEWNKLCDSDYPFIRHEFFAALENTGSTGLDTGWQSHHLIVIDSSRSDHKKIIGIMPLFIKHHSYGEYIFDWSWADAYQRSGLDYYPKLLNAIPFTPAAGPRWLIDKSYPSEKILTVFSDAIINEIEHLQLSSCHCLYTTEHHFSQLAELSSNWQQRYSYQYHWFNQDYKTFDDFLAAMSSRKRKNIIKERRKIQDHHIVMEIKSGKAITANDWKTFYYFYQTTYLKKSGHGGYLHENFFPLLAETLADQLVLIQARKQLPEEAEGEHSVVATALCFKDQDTLYGRYWGCLEEYDGLHFEACYYQGIEYAINNGLKRFDPGAQGEHKIQRGFTPIKTYSNHWIAHPGFRQGLQQFLNAEQKEVEAYIKKACEFLPFKKEC